MSNHKLLLKRGLGHAWRACRHGRGARDVVLLYHSVGGGPLSTQTAQFEQQMDWLVGAHAQVLPLGELLSSKNPGKALRVAITFDDGYATLFHVARPIFKRLGFKPTVFLTSGMLHEMHETPSQAHAGHYPQEAFLSWPQVRDLLADGWSAGCHGWQHLDATMIGRDEFKANLERCKAAIQTHTGQPSRMMAFTWGRFTQQTLDDAIALGMVYSFSCIHGAVARPLHARQAIKRIDIRPDLVLQDFASIVRGDWDYLGALQSTRHLVRDRNAL
jgi:peptidoglycan/xylan/chitin deacetylase (PgdA/CDA1 family)